MPGSEKEAEVVVAEASAKVVVPGPLSWLHVVVMAPGEAGRPSSVVVAERAKELAQLAS